MKITKRQLKRIIREEKQKILQESPVEKARLMEALDEFVDVLDEEMGYGVPNDVLKEEVYKLVDEYFAQQQFQDHGESGGWDQA